MTREETKRLLMTIEAIYSNFKIRDLQVTLDAWHAILSDQEANAIFASLKQYSRTNETGFAPDPGQLIQGVYKQTRTDTLSASEAWVLVYKALCRSSYYAEEEFNKLPPEVQEAVGSPGQLRAWAVDENFAEGVASSNFRRAYEVACARKKEKDLMPEDVKKLFEEMDRKRIGELK